MLQAITDVCLRLMDFLLGWTLHLPWGVALFIVAALTSLALTVVRLFTTNQNRLKRCKADKARLKELRRQAKQAKDKEARKRYAATMQQIAMEGFKAEGLPLLASLIPIALLAVWAFSRLDYYPPAAGAAVPVRLTFPGSEVGTLAHLRPLDGVESKNGWIRQVKPDPNSPEGGGFAEWDLLCRKQDAPYDLRFRQGGETLDHPMLADGLRHPAPLGVFRNDTVTLTMDLVEYKPFVPARYWDYVDIGWNKVVFGVQVAWDWGRKVRTKAWNKVVGLFNSDFNVAAHNKDAEEAFDKAWNIAGEQHMPFLPPWLVGYLVIVIPLAVFLKPLLRIC